MSPWLVKFFNATAGLEKVIIGAVAVLQVYIGSLETLSDPEKALYVGMLGLVQILYTANTKPVDPQNPEKPLR